MKKTILLFLLLISVYHLKADEDIRFQATTTSNVVQLNTPFQLVYTINTSAHSFEPPVFNNFDILAGPFQSTSSYTQYVNGKRSHSTTLTYTFTLMPNKKGTFKIPSASIYVDKNKIRSNTLTIKVVKGSKPSSKSSSAGRQQSNNSTARTTNIGKNNVFIRTIVSKKNVYEQEPILVTYKLYTLVDVAQFTDIQLPDYNGFLREELPLSKHKQLSYQTFNGRNYGTVILFQSVLFPQQTGTLEIPKAKFKAMLRLQNKRHIRSIFDDFFDTYTNVEKTLIAPKVKINVKKLPQNSKPANFSGGVGQFNIKSHLSKKEIETNEAVTLTIKISGRGNLKLINTPQVKFPSHFEVYDPKIKNNFKAKGNGLTGTKTIEYIFIPRHKGSYKIPSVAFTYFDLNKKTYKTINTPVYTLHVAKAENDKGNTLVAEDFTLKEKVKKIATDINYIHTNKHQFLKESQFILGTKQFWLLFFIPLFLAIVVFFIIKKKINENSNIPLVKNKRAKKEAKKRLKQAKIWLQKGRKEKFYAEIMTAMRLYLSDKLTIPTSELNRDNIRDKMLQKKIDDRTISKLFEILDKCEYATYAPLGAKENMSNIYHKSANIISQLEQTIKRK